MIVIAVFAVLFCTGIAVGCAIMAVAAVRDWQREHRDNL